MSVVIPVGETNTEAALPFSVFADLRLETNGHRVHLVGDGRSLVMHTSDPRKLLHDVRQMSLPVQISGMSGRTALGRAADGLREVGIRVDVRGPDGILVRLGDGPQSKFGRVVTGSSAVEFGKVRDLSVAAGLPAKRTSALVVAGICLGLVLLLRRLFSN